MRNHITIGRIVLSALTAFAATAADGSAQLAEASASSLGLSSNNTAIVRGFGAIGVNPAGLAMPGSGFSFALVPVQVRTGLDPIGLSDVKEFEGRLVPDATKESWLTRIEADGGQTGAVGIDVSAFALTVGNFGLQVSTVGGGDVNMPPGMVELLLFGNGGRDGTATDVDLSGAAVDGFGLTTAGLSYAFALPSSNGAMAIGATIKYTVGHGLAIGRGTGFVQSDPIEIGGNFPMVHSCEVFAGTDGTECDDFDPNGGTGVGLDIGFMSQSDRFSFGVSIQNLVHSFKWDETRLAYRAGSATFEQGSSESTFDPESYAGAPETLRTLVDDHVFKPSARLGVAYAVDGDFTLTGDVHSRFSDEGIALTPKFHAGIGAEYRGLRFLHMRAGGAVITEGIQYSAGASLVLGPVNLSAAMAAQTGDIGDNLLGHFALSFGNR